MSNMVWDMEPTLHGYLLFLHRAAKEVAELRTSQFEEQRIARALKRYKKRYAEFLPEPLLQLRDLLIEFGEDGDMQSLRQIRSMWEGIKR